MATEPENDDSLLPRIAAGDADAFTALFRRRHREIFRFALHLSGSPAVAEDVTQDVFVTVMEHPLRYEPGRSTVPAWLCGIARNHVRRRLGDRPMEPLPEESGSDADIPAVTPDPVADLARTRRLRALSTAILSLPLRYREAVALCDLQELSYADAAVAAGCAVGTIRSRLHRARALLGLKLRRAHPDTETQVQSKRSRVLV